VDFPALIRAEPLRVRFLQNNTSRVELLTAHAGRARCPHRAAAEAMRWSCPRRA